jgi:hypothetical protein
LPFHEQRVLDPLSLDGLVVPKSNNFRTPECATTPREPAAAAAHIPFSSFVTWSWGLQLALLKMYAKHPWRRVALAIAGAAAASHLKCCRLRLRIGKMVKDEGTRILCSTWHGNNSAAQASKPAF